LQTLKTILTIFDANPTDMLFGRYCNAKAVIQRSSVGCRPGTVST